MQDFTLVTGIVIKQAPVGESDRRVTLLTNSMGKISAFARGARKPNSRFSATTCPYCFGTFKLFLGRDSFTIADADISNHFEGLLGDVEGSCYCAYFAEIVDYYCRENNDEREMMKLLYTSLLAILSEKLPNRLVRSVFELKSIMINGEYPGTPSFMPVSNGLLQTLEFIRTTPIKSLYTFNVTDDILLELEKVADKYRKMVMEHSFKSLEILECMVSQ